MLHDRFLELQRTRPILDAHKPAPGPFRRLEKGTTAHQAYAEKQRRGLLKTETESHGLKLKWLCSPPHFRRPVVLFHHPTLGPPQTPKFIALHNRNSRPCP